MITTDAFYNTGKKEPLKSPKQQNCQCCRLSLIEPFMDGSVKCNDFVKTCQTWKFKYELSDLDLSNPSQFLHHTRNVYFNFSKNYTSYIHTNNASHYYNFSLITIPIFPTFFIQIICANWKKNLIYINLLLSTLWLKC